MDAYNEILNRIEKLETTVNNIENTKLKNINGTLDICVRNSDLQTTKTRLQSDIQNISNTVNALETKLSKVYLPNETKYYMDEDELKSLRNKIRQMNVLFIRLQNLEKHIIETLNATLLDNTDLTS